MEFTHPPRGSKVGCPEEKVTYVISWHRSVYFTKQVVGICCVLSSAGGRLREVVSKVLTVSKVLLFHNSSLLFVSHVCVCVFSPVQCRNFLDEGDFGRNQRGSEYAEAYSLYPVDFCMHIASAFSSFRELVLFIKLRETGPSCDICWCFHWKGEDCVFPMRISLCGEGSRVVLVGIISCPFLWGGSMRRVSLYDLVSLPRGRVNVTFLPGNLVPPLDTCFGLNFLVPLVRRDCKTCFTVL